jgi:arsenite-transporting ATPase
LISTDPAHNVSDAFDQKFAKDPVKVKNFENLWCMEIDPSANEGTGGGFFGGLTGEHGMEETEEGAESTSFMKELFQSVPGIDEATAFGAIMSNLDDYNFDLIIFDTAPTGHTLRLLNFPSVLEKGLLKLMELKDKFGGMMGQVSGMMGG